MCAKRVDVSKISRPFYLISKTKTNVIHHCQNSTPTIYPDQLFAKLCQASAFYNNARQEYISTPEQNRPFFFPYNNLCIIVSINHSRVYSGSCCCTSARIPCLLSTEQFYADSWVCTLAGLTSSRLLILVRMAADIFVIDHCCFVRTDYKPTFNLLRTSLYTLGHSVVILINNCLNQTILVPCFST